MRSFNKVFVIALPRCATVSMCDALGELGVPTAHLGKIYGEPTAEHNDPFRLKRMHQQIQAGDFQLDVLKQCSGLADYPVCSFDVLEQLDMAYPDSLFINVRRDDNIQRWLQSVERQFVGLQLVKSGQQASEDDKEFMRVVMAFREMTFGQAAFDVGIYLDAYQRFQRCVGKYFVGRETALLEIDDVSQLEDSGFRQLCHFLDCSLPGVAFPRNNDHSTAPFRAFMSALAAGQVSSQTGIQPQPVVQPPAVG